MKKASLSDIKRSGVCLEDTAMNNHGISSLLTTCKKKGIRFAVLVGFFLLSLTESQAQHNINYALHANIIYRFTKYIDWPKDYKTGNFVIGVVGETPLLEELKKYIVNKTVRSQKIVITQYSVYATSFNCHILFVSEDESDKFKKIAARTEGTATLLVSETDGLARKGSCINFTIVNEHLKLEFNKTNIETRQLNIASELLQLGVIVK